jgi:hypothetical protein
MPGQSRNVVTVGCFGKKIIVQRGKKYFNLHGKDWKILMKTQI